MKEKNYKKCVICGKEYPCTPSRNVVTCSRECRLKYLSQNHIKGEMIMVDWYGTLWNGNGDRPTTFKS